MINNPLKPHLSNHPSPNPNHHSFISTHHYFTQPFHEFNLTHHLVNNASITPDHNQLVLPFHCFQGSQLLFFSPINFFSLSFSLAYFDFLVWFLFLVCVHSGYESNESPMVVSMFGNQIMGGDNVGVMSEGLYDYPYIDSTSHEKGVPNEPRSWIGMEGEDEEVVETAKQQPHFFDFLGLGTS